jgi:PAS domain S-box-containing protein
MDTTPSAPRPGDEDLLHTRHALEARTQQLTHSLSMLQAAFESTADGLLVTAEDGRVAAFNTNFLNMWSLARDAVEGATHGEVMHQLAHHFDEDTPLTDRIAELFASHSLQALDTLELIDGRVIERYSRPQQVDGQAMGRVWSYRDVTARTRVDEAMREEARMLERMVAAERTAHADIARVSRLKDDFLATLSHELRTPLTAILGWARLLLRKPADEAALRRGLGAIERNAVAQARLIEDLLDMNGIISGKVRLDLQPMDLGHVVEAVVEAVRPLADDKDIQVHAHIDAPTAAVSGDASRLQQVVWNLLTNAVKFTPNGGEVIFRLCHAGGQLELQVSDSGIGIADDFLPYVFDRFRQADSSITRGQGGLGLGLAIVKQLVELHGGQVRATSGGQARGSSFFVTLPQAAGVGPRADEPRTAVHAAPSFAEVDLRQLKVLVVDDEADARELIGHLLTESQAEVHTASSAAEALEMLPRLRPDLLLSDIGMPGCDGYALIRAVRRLPPEQGGRTPAAAITAFARPEDRALALAAGYQVHVAKPIEPHELVATLAGLARRVVV